MIAEHLGSALTDDRFESLQTSL